MAHHGYMKYQDHISVAECEPCPYHVCHRAYVQVADDDGAKLPPPRQTQRWARVKRSFFPFPSTGDAEYMCACAACWWSSWRLGDMLTGFLCTYAHSTPPTRSGNLTRPRHHIPGLRAGRGTSGATGTGACARAVACSDQTSKRVWVWVCGCTGTYKKEHK